MDRSPRFNTDADSGLRFGGAGKVRPLEILRSGEAMLVAFSGRDASESDELRIAEYRDQFLELIQQQQCRSIAIDLKGVQRVASGIVGLLVTIRRRLDCVELRNVTATVRESLRVTKLDTYFQVHETQA